MIKIDKGAPVNIANVHDGVALTGRNAATLARYLEAAIEDELYDGSPPTADVRLLRDVANILRGRMRDGSEPEVKSDA